jgi:hypothetical protein
MFERKEPAPLFGAKLVGAIEADTREQERAAIRAAAAAIERGDAEAIVRELTRASIFRARLGPLAEAYRIIQAELQAEVASRTVRPEARPRPAELVRSGVGWAFAGKPLGELRPSMRAWHLFVEQYGCTPAEAASTPKWMPSILPGVRHEDA